MVTPVARREALALVKDKGLSERAACRMTGVSRQVGSYELKQPDKDRMLTASLVEASGRYPRFGYRRIAVMTCQSAGRVWRLWNRLGLNLPNGGPGSVAVALTYAFLVQPSQIMSGRMISYMIVWPMEIR